jgi:cytochrome c oxidase subunit 1
MFPLLLGLIGTAFSVITRLELSGPGVQFITDNQLYNSIITAHAIVMIFFMVMSAKTSTTKYMHMRKVTNKTI